MSEAINIRLNAVERALHDVLTELARDELTPTIHNVRDRYENRTTAKLSFWEAYDRFRDEQDIEIKAIRKGTLTYFEGKTSSIKTRPISKRAQAIIKKYEGFPSYSNQKFNKYAKKVCNEAGIDEPVFSSAEWVPKWSQVTTRTGRFSFVTNMLLSKVPLTVVQRIWGMPQ